MKPLSVRGVGVVMVALCGLVSPSVASAALPSPSHARVVPFQSIGKIALGTSKAKAFSAWGRTSLCAVGTKGRETCDWLSTNAQDFPEEGGVLELSRGKVCGMLMRAGTNPRADKLTVTRLKKWKTKQGIGLGSSLTAAKHSLGGRLVVTKHHVTTSILGGTTPATKGKVEEITIFRQGCEVT